MKIDIKKMAGLNQEMRLYDVDIEEYVYDRLLELWYDAVRVFVVEAQKHIGIDTGMSAASMLPLAEEVGIDTILRSTIMNARKRTLAGRYRPPSPFPSLSIYGGKSMQAGEDLGKDAYTMEVGSPLIPKFSFSFSLLVYQYYFHEDTWQSLQYGKEAFELYLNENAQAYLDPDDLIKLAMKGSLL